MRGGDGRRAVVVAAAAYAGLLGITYAAQRAIVRNGPNVQFPEFASVLAPSDPRSPTRLAWTGGVFLVATLASIAIYLWLIARARADRLGPRATRLALGCGVAFHLVLLFGRPYLSFDLLTYVAYGLTSLVTDWNQYELPARALIETDVASSLLAQGWVPVHSASPYGPIWTALEIGATRITQDVVLASLLLKAVVVASSLAAGWFIWLILGIVRPEDRTAGTLAYLWSPLVLFEFAAEGHNDVVMIAAALGATYLTLRHRPIGATVAGGVATLCKYISGMLGPAHAIYLWRRAEPRARTVRGIAIGLALVLALAVATFAPFWVGAHTTFQGLREAGEVGFFPSTGTMSLWALQRVGLVVSPSSVQLVLTLVFLAIVLVAASRVFDAGTFARACGAIGLAYYLLGAPKYWPWYAGLPLALAALWPRGTIFWVAIVATIGSRLVAVLEPMWRTGTIEWSTLTWGLFLGGIAAPQVTLLALVVRDRLSRR